MFSLERRPPPADLARFVDLHWLVSWDLRCRPPYRSQVLPHPCVHLVFEPAGATVHGISRRRFERRLEGAGWAVGTKFLPGGCAPFTSRAVCELTGRVLRLGEVFGDGGSELERSCPPPARARSRARPRPPVSARPDSRGTRSPARARRAGRRRHAPRRPGRAGRRGGRPPPRLRAYAAAAVLGVCRHRPQVGAAALPPARTRPSSSCRVRARSTGRAWHSSSATTTRPTSRGTFARWSVARPRSTTPPDPI